MSIMRRSDSGRGSVEILVGRGDAVDIRLDSPTVSENHASFRLVRDEMLEVTDLGSGNGVFVNRKKVPRGLVCRTDRVTLGQVPVNLDEVLRALKRKEELARRRPSGARAQDPSVPVTQPRQPRSSGHKAPVIVTALALLLVLVLAIVLASLETGPEVSDGFEAVVLTQKGGMHTFKGREGEVLGALVWEEGAVADGLEIGVRIETAAQRGDAVLFRVESDRPLQASEGKQFAVAVRVPDWVPRHAGDTGFPMPIFRMVQGEPTQRNTAARQDGSAVAGLVVEGRDPGSRFVVFGTDHFSGYFSLVEFLDNTRSSLEGPLANGEKVSYRVEITDKGNNTVPLWLPSGWLQSRVLSAWSGNLLNEKDRQKVYEKLLREVFMQADAAQSHTMLTKTANAFEDTLNYVSTATGATGKFLTALGLTSEALRWQKPGGGALDAIRIPTGKLLRDFFVSNGAFEGSTSTYHAAFARLGKISGKLGKVTKVAGLIIKSVLIADDFFKWYCLPGVMQQALVERRIETFEAMLMAHSGPIDPALPKALAAVKVELEDFYADQSARFVQSLVQAFTENSATALTLQAVAPKLASLAVSLLPKGAVTVVAAKLGIGAAAAGGLIGVVIVAVVYTVIDVVEFEKGLVAATLSVTLAQEYLGPHRRDFGQGLPNDGLWVISTQELYANNLYFQFMSRSLKEFNIEGGAHWMADHWVDLHGKALCAILKCEAKQPTFLAYRKWIGEEAAQFDSYFKKYSSTLPFPRTVVDAQASFDGTSCTLSVKGSVHQKDTTGPVTVWFHPDFTAAAAPGELKEVWQGVANTPAPFSLERPYPSCKPPLAVLLQARPEMGAYGVKIVEVECQGGKCGPEPFKDPGDQKTKKVEVVVNQVEIEGDKVKVYAIVTTQAGTPLENLTAGNFLVREFRQSKAQQFRPESVASVETAGEPASICLVMDSSGSMRGGKLAAAKRAAAAFISNLKPEDRAALLEFKDVLNLRQAFSTNRAGLQVAINSMSSGGGTALWDAIIKAVTMTRKQSGRQAIIALTDGKDENSQATLAKAIKAAQDAGIPVFTIGLGVDASTRAKLKNLSDGTNAGKGGQGYYDAPTAADLQRLYDSISSKLKKTYIVTWTTTGSPGQTIEATVTVTYSCAAGTFTEKTPVKYVVP